MQFVRKYGTQAKIRIPVVKAGSSDFAVGADWTPATGDVKVSKDGGAAANIGTLPTAIAMGNGAIWEFTISATEMQAAEVTVTVVDSATKAVQDQALSIITFANASAGIVVDWSDSVRAGLTALPNAAAGANGGLPLSVDASGRVDVLKINGTSQTARDIGASVLLSSGTGTGQLDFTSGVVKANATQWLGGTIPAVNVTGVPLVDLKYTLGTISPATAGSVRADAVTGAVGSVTGAVGSVTGNVGGNVVGSVASVTAGVTLAASAVQAIWDALTSALTTVGSIGKLLVDNINATISSRLPTSSYTAPTNLTSSQIATGVWQDATAGDFTAANSVGKSLMNGVSLGTGLTVNDITTKTGYSLSGTQTFNNTGTWTGNVVGTLSTLTTYTGNTPQTGDAFARIGSAGAGLTALGDARIANLDAAVSSRSTYVGADTAGTTTLLSRIASALTITGGKVDVNDKTGFSLSAGGIQAVWDALTSALTSVGSIGKLLVDNVDAAISSRSTYAGSDTSGTTTLLTRIPGTVQPQTGDSFARIGAAGAGLTALGDVRIANLDATISSRLASASYTAPLSAASTRSAVGLSSANLDTQLSSIKTKTDNIPASPAAVGDAMTLTSSYDFAKGTVVMTESYAINGAAPTPVQCLYGLQQTLQMFGIVGTSMTVKKLNNSTTAFVMSLDSSTNPTSVSRI